LDVGGGFLKAPPERIDNENMNRRTISTGAVILAIAVVVASCSGSTTPPGVVLEARWQCDVQRLTFDDLSALDAELEGRVAAAGMTIDEYTAFKAQLNASADLRSAVEKEYEEYCLE
jgi:hypothetical protein